MKPEIKQRIEQIKAGQVPDGYKKTKIGIVPTEWSYEKLDKFLIQHREISDYSNQYPVLTSSRKGIFLQNEYYNREVASEDNTGYNVVPRGYFTYRHMSDDEIFKFNINNIVDKGIVSTLYPVFTTKGINDYFLQAVLNEGREFRRFAILQKQGGSRTYMYFDKLKQLKVCLPPIPEQEKIAEILSAQDKVIELQQKKIEELHKLKKIFLRKMFPQKGEKTPEWRFPQFADNWEQCELGDVGSCQSGIGFPDAEQGGTEGIPFFKVSDMNINGNEYELQYANNYVTQEQIDRKKWKPIKEVPAMFFAKVGAAVMLNRKKLVNTPFLLDNNTMAYKFGDNWDTNFGRAIFDTINLASLVQVGALPSYNASDVEGIKITLPTLAEQKEIGTFFRNLDHLISLHQRKLDEMKEYKKLLMQLLLSGIVRV